MKKFVLKTFCFILITILLILTGAKYTSIRIGKRSFKNSNTESNLFNIHDNSYYDILIMGISHARNFSRYGNHELAEDILQKKIINIGQGQSLCGIKVQNYYLEYFYKHKNKVKEVIYVLSPPLALTNYLDLSSNAFEYEPFKLDFLLGYFFKDIDNKWQQIICYIRSKFKKEWLSYQPKIKNGETNILEHIDTNAVKAGFKQAYLDPVTESLIESNINSIKHTIDLCKKNNTKIIFIIPPAVFGKWEGHEIVIKMLKSLSDYQKIESYDLSESILEKDLYYDHHHLNTKGVELFSKQYLKKIINESPVF